MLNALAKNVPWLIGGSADLAPSTKTRLTFDGAGDLSATNPGGRNMHFGIREHAMAATLNGMALVKVRPFGSGFLIFSDYARGSIRLSAIMELPVIHIFTHDSIGVGEDGPTHQPIEQLPSLRAVPGLLVLRPADANEVSEAWKVIMKLHHEPAVLVLTRQALPTFDRTKYGAASGVARGAYILADAPDGKPDVLLLATGSEVSLCVDAYERLKAEGVRVDRRIRERTLGERSICPGQCERPAGLPQGLQHRSALPSGPVGLWQEVARVPAGGAQGVLPRARRALTGPRDRNQYAYNRH